MRALFGAVAVLTVSVLVLSRAVFARDSLPEELRSTEVIIAALQKLPKARGELATVRFYAEVLGGKSLRVWPSMDSSDTGNSNALPIIEQEIDKRACAALGAPELAAAVDLSKEYGETLPAVLRAYTLGHQGKTKEAATMLASYLDGVAPLKGECRGIHPDDAQEAIARVSVAVRCLEVFTPKKDLSKQRKQLQKVMGCALNSNVVG